MLLRTRRRALVPKYLYLNTPGSRWQLADDVDIVDLRQQLDDPGFTSAQTVVVVDGRRALFTIRRDQMHPHAVVDVAGARPMRSAARWMMARLTDTDPVFPKHNARPSLT